MDTRRRSRRYAAVAIRADGRRVPVPVPASTTLLERLGDLVQRVRDRLG